MLTPKWKVNRRYLKLIRLIAIVFGLIFTIHLSRKEGSIMAYKSTQNIDLSGSVQFSNPEDPLFMDFQATAYCVTGITKSGKRVAPGHAAADPKVIPLGSMIYVDSPLIGGIYQVLDTGAKVKGNIVDIFIPSYRDCIEFGRRAVKVQVLRYGFLGYPPENPSSQ